MWSAGVLFKVATATCAREAKEQKLSLSHQVKAIFALLL